MNKLVKESIIPLGMDREKEATWLNWGFIVAVIYSLGFLIKYWSAYDNLYQYYGGKRVIPEGTFMPDFAEILGGSMNLFFVMCVCMIGLAVYHYIYHYQGSKSIYTMRRLPDRWDLWRRCLTVPVMSVLIALALAFILMTIYFAVYMLVTPDRCLLPNQWLKIWG